MIKLIPLSRNNWDHAIALELADDQKDYLPNNLFSIAESKFEPSAELYGLYQESTMIGFAVVCTFSGVPWVTRFMIDKKHQGGGMGRDALTTLVQKLMKKPGVSEVRASIASKNAPAEYMFHSVGFKRTGDVDEREFVMRFEL